MARAIDDRRQRGSVVSLVVGPRPRPLEGFTVNRVWPVPARRLVGPFIFFDHLEAADLPAGVGLDVPPHPHIGLATVTWLFDGELLHADSLGVRQAIRPGELNWMTAGRGIVHSERSTDRARAQESRLHAIQAWVALPTDVEDAAPSFEHVEADRLPVIEISGGRLTLIAGRAFGERSPVATASPLFYLEASLDAGATLELEPGLGERAVYVVSGSIEIAGESFAAGRLLVVDDAAAATMRAGEPARLMLLGGEPLTGTREIWWNFVATDPARIERAKADWSAGRFPAVEGDDETMPMPG